MVSPNIAQFISDLGRGDLKPHLKPATSSSQSLRVGSVNDISTGILKMKDFDDPPEDNAVLLKQFEDSYVNALQSVRLSATQILALISTTVNDVSRYNPDKSAFPASWAALPFGATEGLMASEMATLSIVQAVETANVETNNAYYILKNTLSDISLQLKLRGQTSTIPPGLEALESLAKQLNATTPGRDLLKELYLLEVPAVGMDLGTSWPRDAADSFTYPIVAATAGATKTGTDRWDHYGGNWIMIIDSHIEAVKGLAALYEMGGEAINNLYGPGTVAADEEKKLEAAIAKSHDSIRNRLFFIFGDLRDKAARVGATGAMVGPQWQTAGRTIAASTIRSRAVAPSPGVLLPPPRKFDPTFADELAAMNALKAAAVRGFNLPVPVDPLFGA